MNIGVRFSSPVLDDLDIELLKETFGESIDDVITTGLSTVYCTN